MLWEKLEGLGCTECSDSSLAKKLVLLLFDLPD